MVYITGVDTIHVNILDVHVCRGQLKWLYCLDEEAGNMSLLYNINFMYNNVLYS